jgi:hypothetical protein
MERNTDKTSAVRQRRWNLPLDGVVAKLQSFKVMKITELLRQIAVEVILSKVEPPHVCEVAERRGDGAKEAELAEV